MKIKICLLGLLLLSNSNLAGAETLDSKVVGVSTTDNARKIEKTCLELLKDKEYDKLENYAKSLDTQEEKAKDDSGHIQIYACMNGITEYKQDILLWNKNSPKNIYPYLANNYDSVRIFFNLRGEKTISQTNQTNYDKGQQVLTNSANELDNAKKYGATGLWYDERIRIAFYRQEEKIFDIFKEGSDKYPQYYPIYLAVTGNMKPQWGFPFEVLANISLYSAKHSNKAETYTRIYEQAITPCCNNSIVESQTIDYKLLRTGVGEILGKYPSTFNYNKMAQTACLLKDEALYKKINADMKKNKIPLVSELWFSGKAYQCQELLSSVKY